MDKQQNQIEETAKEKNSKQWQRRDEYCLRIQKATQYKGDCDHEDVPSILVDYEKEIKKELIPENAVVLTREEYHELKQAKTLLEFREETIKYLEDANIRYAEALELKVNEKERKETAEKIMNEISGDILTVNTKEYGNIEVVPVERLQEIIQTLGVNE